MSTRLDKRRAFFILHHLDQRSSERHLYRHHDYQTVTARPSAHLPSRAVRLSHTSHNAHLRQKLESDPLCLPANTIRNPHALQSRDRQQQSLRGAAPRDVLSGRYESQGKGAQGREGSRASGADQEDKGAEGEEGGGGAFCEDGGEIGEEEGREEEGEGEEE